MKICISSTGSNLESLVDSRFGRCLYFIFADDKNLAEIKAIKNSGVRAMHGAGISAAQIVANEKAEAVISGNLGPKALDVLDSSGIKIYQALSGMTVKEALVAFKNNQLPKMEDFHRGGFGHGRGGRGFGRRK